MKEGKVERIDCTRYYILAILPGLSCLWERGGWNPHTSCRLSAPPASLLQLGGGGSGSRAQYGRCTG